MKKSNSTKDKITANRFDEPIPKLDEKSAKPAMTKREVLKAPKAFYHVLLILVLSTVLLVIYLSRQNLQFENLKLWFSNQITGGESQAGFPVAIKGNQAYSGGFLKTNSGYILLTDTALTEVASSGKETAYIRHSFLNPTVKTSSSFNLLYNIGVNEYMLSSGTDVILEDKSNNKIYFGAVAENGTFALGLQGEKYASEFEVFKKDGTATYKYSFATGYATNGVLNSSGTMGAVCTIDSTNGNLFSRITILDFSNESPILTYDLKDNMIFDIFWTNSGNLIAVGDKGAAVMSTKENAVKEYSFNNKQITAYAHNKGKLFLGMSSYEYGGSGEIAVLDSEMQEINYIEVENRVTSLSAFGGSFAAFNGTDVTFYDSVTFLQQSKLDVEADTKAVVMENESSAYLLGASEIRKISIK